MIGQQFGPYQVVAKLGAGGMGEVYRARDTKLNRDVALKILPEAFASDPDRLMRFTREAPAELRVSRAVDLTHTAFAKFRHNLIRAQAVPGFQRHRPYSSTHANGNLTHKRHVNGDGRFATHRPIVSTRRRRGKPDTVPLSDAICTTAPGSVPGCPSATLNHS